MGETFHDRTYLKINIGMLAIWLSCFFILLLSIPSTYVVIPISAGSTLASLFVIFPTKRIKALRYVFLFLILLLGSTNTFFQAMELRYSILFLPLFLYFDTEETPPYLQILVTILSIGFMYLASFPLLILSLTLSFSVLSIVYALSIIEKSTLEYKYYDYYNLSKQEQEKLKQLYNLLTVEQNNKIENAILSERNRMARDIHDSLGHLTSRGILQIGAILVTEKDTQKKEQLHLLKETLSHGLKEVRNSLHDFQNESLNLKKELQKIVDEFQFCDLYFNYSSKSDFSLKFKYSIIFIVKEALSNISLHSNAKKAEISFIETEQKIYLKLLDNGTGAKLSPDGMGLYSIRQRAEELGGSAEFSADNGFRIFITLEKRNDENRISG